MVNYSKNHVSYNNTPVKEGETLVPMRLTWEALKDFGISADNYRTWNMAGVAFPVIYTIIPEAAAESYMKMFWQDINDFLNDYRTRTDEQKKYIPVSLDDLNEESGNEPATSTTPDDIVASKMELVDLFKYLTELDPGFARVVELRLSGYDKKEIFEELGKKKSQGYVYLDKVDKALEAFVKKYNA